MNFSILAEYFQKLEKTPSRNNMVVILSEMFAAASKDEAKEISFLSQGRVAPLFVPLEFGMADRMVIKSIAQAYSKSNEEVTELFKEKGDLGIVAESLAEEEKKVESKLSVSQVFQSLTKMAKVGGEGSVELKVSILADLLKDLDSLSVRYVVRIPLGRLRLGFSDMTVLEGLSWMLNGSIAHLPIFSIISLPEESLSALAIIIGVPTSGETSFKLSIPFSTTITDDPQEVENIFQEKIAKGLEGIMAKRLDGVYQAGARGWNWIKYKRSYQGKLEDTIDAVVMGYDYGQGKRTSFGIGDFLIGVYDSKNDTFETIAKIGTGLTDEEWKKMKALCDERVAHQIPARYVVDRFMVCDVWVNPEIVVTIRADEISKSPRHTAGRTANQPGYALRFPRLIAFRTDKSPEDATTIVEIEDMFQLQYHQAVRKEKEQE